LVAGDSEAALIKYVYTLVGQYMQISQQQKWIDRDCSSVGPFA
jgi:hypothetical protein